MKIIIIISILCTCLVLPFLSCSLSDNDPVSSAGSFSSTYKNENPITALSISGTMISGSDNVPVSSSAAVLKIRVYRKLQEKSIPVTIHEMDSANPVNASVVSVTGTYDIDSNISVITVNPVNDLKNSQRYFVKIYGDSILDADGNTVDLDLDNINGETPDDNISYYFVTQTAVGGIGTYPQVSLEDTIPPLLSSGLFYWNSAKIDVSDGSANIPVNPAFFLRVSEQQLNSDRIGYSTVAYSGSTLDNSIIWIRKKEDRATVSVTVSVVSDPDTSYALENSTVRITLNEALTSNTGYEFVVDMNAIKDGSGNKMSENDASGGGVAIISFTTGNNTVDGLLVSSDATAPFVSDWSTATKLVTFSERIDPATLTGGSIFVKDTLGNLLPVTLGIIEDYNPSSTLVTMVRVTSISSLADSIFVNMDLIKDIPAGNKGSGVFKDQY